MTGLNGFERFRMGSDAFLHSAPRILRQSPKTIGFCICPKNFQVFGLAGSVCFEGILSRDLIPEMSNDCCTPLVIYVACTAALECLTLDTKTRCLELVIGHAFHQCFSPQCRNANRPLQLQDDVRFMFFQPSAADGAAVLAQFDPTEKDPKPMIRTSLPSLLPLRQRLQWLASSASEAMVSVPSDGGLRRLKQHQRSSRSVCPFTVHRTASDNLPVYVVKRKNRTEDVTVVKKLRGDQEALKREIEFLCRTRASYGRSGFLQVVGNHRRAIKAYLRSVGY